MPKAPFLFGFEVEELLLILGRAVSWQAEPTSFIPILAESRASLDRSTIFTQCSRDSEVPSSAPCAFGSFLLPAEMRWHVLDLDPVAVTIHGSNIVPIFVWAPTHDEQDCVAKLVDEHFDGMVDSHGFLHQERRI